MNGLKKIIKRVVTCEKGGISSLLAFILVFVLFGFTAMVVDAGSLYQTKREMVTIADAAALAGAQELPFNTEEAKKQAKIFASENGYTLSDDEIDFPPENNDRRIVITIKREERTYFASFIHESFKEVDVAAIAAAERMLLWDGNPTIVSYLDDANNALELKGQFHIDLNGDALVHSNGGLEVKDNLVKTGDGKVLGTAVGKIEDKVPNFFDSTQNVNKLNPPLTQENIQDYLDYWGYLGLSVHIEIGKVEVEKNETLHWGYDVVYVNNKLEVEGTITGNALIIVKDKIEVKGNGTINGVVYCLGGEIQGVEFKNDTNIEGNPAGVIEGLILSNTKIELKDKTMVNVTEGIFSNLPPIYTKVRLVK